MASKNPKVNLTRNRGRCSLDGIDGFTTSTGSGSIFTGTIGDITAQHVVIAGQMKGPVIAREKMEIVCTVKIRGSLTSPFIAIAEGAMHEGEIHMAKTKHFTDQRDRC